MTPDTTGPTVLGVDGARRGWVGVVWDGAAPVPCFAPTLEALCGRAEADAGPIAAVAIDMPIELEHTDRRRCDVEARPLLGARRSSLFAPPLLAAIDHTTYAAANAWSKAAVGRGISKQAWMLVPKIREVRAFVTGTDLRVHETFPELSFRAMNGGRPLTHAKRTWTGMASRLELLQDAGLVLPVEAGDAGDVAADDLVDAAALAWSAMRIARGRGEHVPAALVDGEASIWW